MNQSHGTSYISSHCSSLCTQQFIKPVFLKIHWRMSLKKQSQLLILFSLDPWVHIFLVFCMIQWKAHISTSTHQSIYVGFSRIIFLEIEFCAAVYCFLHGTPFLLERTAVNYGQEHRTEDLDTRTISLEMIKTVSKLCATLFYPLGRD